MNSPKFTAIRSTQPNSAGKQPSVQVKAKSPQTPQEQQKNLAANKAPMTAIQKQLSPVSRPLQKTKTASSSNLQSGQFVGQKSQVERIPSPNLDPHRKIQPQPITNLGQKPQPNLKSGGTTPVRNIAPRMSQEPMSMTASKTRFLAEEPNNMKGSMIEDSSTAERSSPTFAKEKRAPRMSEPVNSPYNLDNNPNLVDFQQTHSKEPSLSNLPVVPEETNSNRFVRPKPLEMQHTSKKPSGEVVRPPGEHSNPNSPVKPASPIKTRSDHADHGFMKKMTLTETVSTDSNSIGTTGYRTLASSPRLAQQRQNMVSGNSPTRQRTHKIEDFVIGKQLGSGKFGNVFAVKHKLTGFMCALKIIPKEMVKEENIVNQLTRELKIQSCLDHPNIIKLFGFFDDEKNVYLLLELGSSGQLYRVLKEKGRFTEETTSYIVKQICQAIRYLHTFRIIHRDIKPENIVLQHVHRQLRQGIAKMCDFGWAVCRGMELRSTFCGTPLYVSPEILKGEQYDERIDLWSIGILAYEMLVGDIPFEITREEELIKIISDEIRFPEELKISTMAKDFVMRILQRNPEDRLKISQLLEHPFLNLKASSEVCNELDI